MTDRFAVMMLCRAGTISLNYNPLSWRADQHVVTVLATDTEAEAWREINRLRPVGFNREEASFWVAPWGDRFNPYLWPLRAVAAWGH